MYLFDQILDKDWGVLEMFDVTKAGVSPPLTVCS
jgi:hypothetical protein